MGQNIYKSTKWEFNKEVSEVFDEHVRQSIPMYDEFQKIVLKLSEFFVRNNTYIYDLGCSTGETIYLLNQKNDKLLNKNINFIAVDNSPHMIEKARQKCSQWNNIEYLVANIEDVTFSNQTYFIISLFTLQFLSERERAEVIRNIYNGLENGGAFIFVEKSYPCNVISNDIFTQVYHDFKEEQGFSSFDIREKDKSLRSVLIPLSIDENYRMLEECGFKKIDIFMKYLSFTGFIAIK